MKSFHFAQKTFLKVFKTKMSSSKILRKSKNKLEFFKNKFVLFTKLSNQKAKINIKYFCIY